MNKWIDASRFNILVFTEIVNRIKDWGSMATLQSTLTKKVTEWINTCHPDIRINATIIIFVKAPFDTIYFLGCEIYKASRLSLFEAFASLCNQGVVWIKNGFKKLAKCLI